MRMKRWMALFTIALWVAGVATPPMVDAAGGCSPSISNSSNKTVSGTSGNITVAAAASLATPVGTVQTGGKGGNAAASTIGNTGAAQGGNGGSATGAPGGSAQGGAGAVGAVGGT